MGLLPPFLCLHCVGLVCVCVCTGEDIGVLVLGRGCICEESTGICVSGRREKGASGVCVSIKQYVCVGTIEKEGNKYCPGSG